MQTTPPMHNNNKKRSQCFASHAKLLVDAGVLLSTGSKKKIIPKYWLLFSINLNSSNAAVQIQHITSDFQCKYLQLWWNWLTLSIQHSFIHSLVTFCVYAEKNENFHSSTFIANIESKTECTIMQKLSVHELVIGLNVQRNGQMKLTVPSRKRSPEVNGFLLQYIRALCANGTLKLHGKKHSCALCISINEYYCKPIPQVDLFDVSQFNYTHIMSKGHHANGQHWMNEFEW